MRIRREVLYEQIWRESMTKVASRLDVSSNYLARVCESLNVPHPARGYWARKAAGANLPVPPLPAAKPGDPVEWVRGRAVAETASFADYSPPLPRPASKRRPLSSPSPLVIAWQAHLEQAATDEVGYLWPRKKNVLDVFITRDALRSATVTLNSLFNELHNRGHAVRLEGAGTRPRLEVPPGAAPARHQEPRTWAPNRATIASIAAIRIGLCLFERSEYVRVRRVGTDRYVRIKDLPPVRRYGPQSPNETDMMRNIGTGCLVLRAYCPIYDTGWSQEWEEHAPGELLPRTAEIVDALEAATPRVAQLAAEAEHRAEERRRAFEEERRAWQRQERARTRAEEKRKALKELRAIIEGWSEARTVEAFLAELRHLAGQMEPDARAELEARIDAVASLVASPDSEDPIQRFMRLAIPSAHELAHDPEEDGDT